MSITQLWKVSCQEAGDLVDGNLIEFNNNGAWCWYQDERAVVDTVDEILILGSDASGSGTGGSSRNGRVEGVVYDLNNGLSRRKVFRNTGCDDHNAPAFLIRPDGKYLTVYADHYDSYSRYRIYDGTAWGDEQLFDWSTIPGGTDFSTTYSNLFYLPAEQQMYNFVRCYARSPNILVSADQGDTWTYGGLLTEPDVSVGYVNGYFKYSSNGYNRIDFVGTEHHPRDYYTSIYHGYIMDGKSYNSYGTLMDSYIYDKHAPYPNDFTQVFASNTIVNGINMTRCWTIELQNYGDTIATIFEARANDNELDHRFFYARFDGSSWVSTYLCKAGSKLYSSEQDYVGLGALDPKNPNIIYISTPFDPRNDSALEVREIFKGITADRGATWNWTPVTQNSTRDNLRPIIPAWNENTALLWMRGTYYTAQIFDMTIVGILDNPHQAMAPMKYVDASVENTSYADNSLLVTTGPDANNGPDDDLWHIRTGYGNGNDVFTSSETDGEDAPTLKTTIKTDGVHVVDVWINFWANPEADWRIMAGQSPENLQIFRQMACKQVENDDHMDPIILTGNGNTYLYQAYLGKMQAAADSSIEVYIDDYAVQTGTNNTLTGDIARTWYDGISYSTTLYTDIEPGAIVLSDTANSTASFYIHSNTDWSITGLESWFDLNVISGNGEDTIVLTSQANGAAEARMAQISVNSENIASGVIDVYQTAALPVLSASDTLLTMAANDNSTTGFRIFSNSVWHLSGAEDWLTVSHTIGANNDSITLKAAFNPGSMVRSALIDILIGDSVYQSVIIEQNANPMLYVSINSIALGYSASGLATFTVVSNTDWSLTTDGSSWLSPDQTNGSGNAAIVLTVSENTGSTSRQATITVSAEGLEDQTVTVTQAAFVPEASVSEGDIFGVIYPNPVNDKLYGILKDTPVTIRLYTAEGKQLNTIEVTGNTFEMELQDLTQGVYIIQIITPEQTFSRLIMKN